MQEKTFILSETGHKLSAIHSRSSKDSKETVVWCHGLNSSKDSTTIKRLEKLLLPKNISVFRFDFYAHGESEGEKTKRDLNKFVSNVKIAIKHVKSLGYENIGLFGSSFGGVASVIAASENDDVKVMALKAPGMGQTSRNMSEYNKDFTNKTWIKAGEKVKIPTLIVHGSGDKDVEVSFGELLSKSIKKSKLIIYEGANHLFTKKEDFERMTKDISDFFHEKLK